jgi:DNA-directed RNA polymerase subunit RPC12/RpoP
MKPKQAQVFAESLAVVCPYCGGAFTNNDGSEMWLPDELQELQGIAKCPECDAKVLIAMTNKAQIQYTRAAVPPTNASSMSQ